MGYLISSRFFQSKCVSHQSSSLPPLRPATTQVRQSSAPAAPQHTTAAMAATSHPQPHLLPLPLATVATGQRPAPAAPSSPPRRVAQRSGRPSPPPAPPRSGPRSRPSQLSARMMRTTPHTHQRPPPSRPQLLQSTLAMLTHGQRPTPSHLALAHTPSQRHLSSLVLPLPRRLVLSLLVLVPSLPCSCKCLLVNRPVFEQPDHFMITFSGYGIA